MLVLSRKEQPASGPNEKSSIIMTIPPSAVPQTVTVNVLSIRPNNVRLGIEADRDIAIWRGELDAAAKPAA